MAKKQDITVFITTAAATCEECGEALGRSAWIHLTPAKGALCLACADLDHLQFLPTGRATLTRQARKLSGLSAVVLRFSRARRRYERQGLLVEEAALEAAEEACLADADIRAARRERAAIRREEQDQEYIERFAGRVRELYPNCPPGRAKAIAEHACLKYSGRVGRSAAAKSLDSRAVQLAVTAHIRHNETDYDELWLGGMDRLAAREQVLGTVEQVLAKWAG